MKLIINIIEKNNYNDENNYKDDDYNKRIIVKI